MVQLAKVDGLRVVADAADRDEELVRGLGADIVVPRGDDIAEQIRKVVPEGVDAVADGAIQHTLVLAAVRDGGAVAAVRPFQGETERGIGIRSVMVSRYAREQGRLDDLRRLVEDGALTLRVAGTFPAEEAPEAHRLLEAGGVRGRLVITF
jgi:NADPH:quinone reductase-like Zn-dependent oxidoreductase